GGTLSKLVFTADESGAANNITVAVSGDSDGNDADNVGLSAFVFSDVNNGNMDEKSAALDAMLLLDGEYPVTSATNEFSNAIQGVTITAKSASPGETGLLNVGLDKTAISGKLAEFVEAFNALSDALDFLTDYDQAADEAGLLTGDFAARTIETQIRRTVSSALEGGGQFSTLASIGITTQRDGSLKLDSSKLNTALANNFDDVANLLGGENGVFSKLDERVDDFLSSDGLIASRNSSFLAQLKDIDEQRERLTLRVESFSERIRKQYTSLDILVGQLQSTGDFVTSQLDMISSGMSNKKK
ncbi:MAG: flagellar filament capping protein FliD, partial [Ketobacter sp.]